MNQIATQPDITRVKRLRKAKTQIFNNRGEGEFRTTEDKRNPKFNMLKLNKVI